MTKAIKVTAFLMLTAAAFAQTPGSAAAATGKAATKAPAKTTAKAAAAPQPITIPKDAVPSGNNTFSWTDPAGKKWTYAQTPFGVIRSEADPATKPAPQPLAGTKAFDEGDKVRFEQPSPFGAIKWEKKKTELTEDERNLLSSQSSAAGAKQD
jgi:hypothetical protein